jgi:hypothetical protein
MPDVRVVDSSDVQLRLQFLGRDVMLPSVMASDPASAHDPNALPVDSSEALKTRNFDPEASCSQHLQPTIMIRSPSAAIVQKQREHERLLGNLLGLKRNAARP